MAEASEVTEVAHEVDAEKAAFREGGRLPQAVGGEELGGNLHAREVEGHRPVMTEAFRADNVVVVPALLAASLTAARRRAWMRSGKDEE